MTVGGTLQPGNSTGTLTINGDLTFNPDSIYEVELSPADSDRTTVSGLATLNGSVHIVSEPGAYAPGVLYTILSAGSLSGSFTELSSTFASSTFLAPELTYDTTNVYFSLARAATFASVGQTANQIATGAAADTLGYDNAVIQNIVWGTADQARIAYDALSGEIHASAATVLVEDSRYLRDAITGRARQSYGEAPASASLSAWAEPIGARGNRDSDGNAAALSQSTAGLFGGFDATFGSAWRLGVAGGYTRTWFDAADRGSSGSSDNYHLALYGGGQFGPVGLRLGAAHTWQALDTDRGIAFSGFSDTAAATYDARTTQFFGELGYNVALGRSALEPYAGLAYINVDGGPFSELGGAAALTGSSRFNASFATLGLRGSTPLMTGDRIQLALRGGLGWRHAFGDVTPEAALAFAAGGTPFTVEGAPIARDALAVEAGIDLDVTPDAKVSVLYNGQLSADGSDNGVKATLSLRF
jgi:outer membrane autotransporter protein